MGAGGGQKEFLGGLGREGVKRIWGDLCLHLSLILNLKLTVWTCIGGHGMGERRKMGDGGGLGMGVLCLHMLLNYSTDLNGGDGMREG